MNPTLFIIPIISAFIGWITNLIAVKMLFHPQKPIKFLGITIQGVFPKKQQQFAEKLGKLVSNELLSFHEIKDKISNPANIEKLIPEIEVHIENFLRVKLAEQMPMISMFIGDKTIQQLKSIFVEELKNLFPSIMDKYLLKLEADLDLEKIVTEKVAAFSSEKLEDILNQIMKKEFVFIEVIGAVLGFIIGVVQVLISLI